MSAVIKRGAGFLLLWVVLIGFDPLDLVVGVVAAATATWASLRLLVPGRQTARLAALPRLALAFVRQSAIAGFDVARRAFAPRMRLNPGFVAYKTRYARGPARNAFASLSSLLPGTLAVWDDEQGLLYHCLDIEQPIVAELAAEEAAVSCVLQQTAQP